MAQLDDKSRKALHINLNKRIDNANEKIKEMTYWPMEKAPEGKTPGAKKLQDELTAKEVQDIKYLQGRIRDFQMSLRLAFNTNWIIERRDEDIKALGERLNTEYPDNFESDAGLEEPQIREKNRIIRQLNALVKAKKCTRKGCYTGRGYTGLNVSTGEFNLCKCTTQTIDYYKVD